MIKHILSTLLIALAFVSITNAKELSKLGFVYAIDVRNHGESPHSDSHLITDLVEDLKEFILAHNLDKPILIGHSMGGLNALFFALQYPDMIHGLIVLDIAPKSYAINSPKLFALS